MKDGAHQHAGTLSRSKGTIVMHRPVVLVLFASLLLLLGITNNINWGGEHWRSVLQADAKGYYAYLPAILVHGDLHFGFIEAAEATGSNPNLHYDYRVNTAGGTINKYWCGTALLQAPFFLSAQLAEKLSGERTDGYGKIHVMAICLAAIFYALVGMWATARVLGSFGVRRSGQAIVLVVLLFGTHLFYYVIVAPGMSHAYSFALVALFLLAALRYWERPRTISLLAMGLLWGVIVLVRPINGIILLSLPFIAGSWSGLRSGLQGLMHRKGTTLVAILLAVMIPMVQPFIHFLSTGNWWVDSYPGEHFNWTDPHPLDILFSYKKGLFVYTPVLLLGCVGLVHLAKRSRFALVAWVGFMSVLVLVLSSWWNWWYGGSFSARPFVEYLPFFAIPMGLAVQELNGAARRSYLTGLVLLVGLCQVQTFQARYYRIHYEDMDRTRYWNEFLRIDRLL
jgi:hypothetical protein